MWTDQEALDDRRAVAGLITAVLQRVFSSSDPPLFPRHRWTGSDKALDTLLMQVPHCLLSHIYACFVARMDKSGSTGR